MLSVMVLRRESNPSLCKASQRSKKTMKISKRQTGVTGLVSSTPRLPATGQNLSAAGGTKVMKKHPGILKQGTSSQLEKNVCREICMFVRVNRVSFELGHRYKEKLQCQQNRS